MPRRVTNRIPTCIVKVCPMSCFRIRAAALGCRPMGGQVRGIMRACCSTSPGRISLAARSASSPAASRLVWLMRNDSTIDAIYSSAQRIARWWPVTHWSQAARVGPLVVMQTRIAAVPPRTPRQNAAKRVGRWNKMSRRRAQVVGGISVERSWPPGQSHQNMALYAVQIREAWRAERDRAAPVDVGACAPPQGRSGRRRAAAKAGC
jgi:hypothetical protein